MENIHNKEIPKTIMEGHSFDFSENKLVATCKECNLVLRYQIIDWAGPLPGQPNLGRPEVAVWDWAVKDESGVDYIIVDRHIDCESYKRYKKENLIEGIIK